ncbi:MAG: cobalt ECF transporter T component CbiQ [Clostridiales bacterium]
MADIRSKINEIYSLEQLSAGISLIHGIHPLAKLLGTMVYILCIVSFDRYAFSSLVPYIFYPVILMSLAEIPWGMIFKRTLLALPFCLFAGICNLFIDRGILLELGAFSLSYGAVSFFTILFRTFLCVSAVLILVSITRFSELTGEMSHLHLPGIFITLFEMTYRYLGTLLEEALSMYTAYHLRSHEQKALEMKDLGSFIGQLLIRSFDRAERIYQAMKCRGYVLRDDYPTRRAWVKADYLYLLLTCGLPIFLRFINLPLFFGGWLGGLL